MIIDQKPGWCQNPTRSNARAIRLIGLHTVVIAWTLFATPILAAVYRCDSPDGQAIYSDEPCGDGKLLNIEIHSGASTPQGLRESERQFLRQRTQTRESADSLAQPTPDDARISTPILKCQGIRINSVHFFGERQPRVVFLADGSTYEDVDTRRCASLSLNVRGYGGRLKISASELIGRQLIALFPDRTATSAEYFELTDGPERLGASEDFSATACFGYHSDEILRLSCRQ